MKPNKAPISEAIRSVEDHLNSEYYLRSDLSSLDVQYILEQLFKLVEMKKNKKTSKKEVTDLKSEIQAWISNEGQKFKTQALKTKAIKGIKWLGRNHRAKKPRN